MRVSIKNFNVKMDIKNNGIELEVYSPDGTKHLGDLVVTRTKLIWCRGRTQPQNGVAVSWDQFIARMESG